MSDAREALVALLWQADHAPLSAHDPRDGSCQSCPWPLHEMPPEDIADAILAAGWTPPGERVKPSVEDVAKVLNAPVGFRWSDNPEGYRAHQARAVLALLPGRTETEIKAEALREVAPACNCEDDWALLRDRADRIEKEAEHG